MINSELLKEAIADAKAVRNTAVLNAKHALEEAFAPRFHAMFADKLREETVEEEVPGLDSQVAEVSAPNQVSGKGGEAKGPKTKDVTKGEPKKVSDASTHGKTVAIGGKEGAAGSKAPAAPQSIEETAEVELEEESGITSQDLEEIIKELEAEVASEADGEKPEEPVIDPAAASPAEDPAAVPAAPAPAPAPEGDPEADVAPAAAPAPDAATAPAAAAPVPTVPPGDDQAVPPVPGEENADGDVEEEIDLNALLEAMTDDEGEEKEECAEGKLPPWLKDKKGEKEEEDEEDDEKEKVDEIANQGVPTNVGGQDKSGGVKGYPAAPKDASKNRVKGKNSAGDIGSGETGGKPVAEVASLEKENEDLKEALNEHVKAIKYLQGQINEVNLLNAKLLYTTKLFKEFSLDNKQKMRVVETFDLLKNVREVKLTYAGMCEALNFGAGKKKISPKTTSASRITESYAAKPVASTKPSSEIISESKDIALRFQKLAGIKVKKQ